MSFGISVHRPRLIFLAQLVVLAAALCWLPKHALAQEPVKPNPSVEPMVRGPMLPGYARLAEPQVADRLGLSDEQRGQVATILGRRAEALETAADDQRRAILESSEAELAALLDDDQLARWVALAGEVTQRAVKLRFNFRFAAWADVLNWFAEQSGLSLVLDAPPPGTFNYADTKEYTPAEAIDLLNGVLLTKGYTLIRRERMLLVVDILDGVPEELVPEVDLKDLDARGRFELVRVTFPLGTRDTQLVESEVKPLLGEFGKSIPLVQTKQLVVIETAGKVRVIRAVIDSIPEPAKPAPAAEKKEPEKPTLATYPLKNIDPAAALATLKTLFGDGHFIHDTKTNQLMAYAVPSQQAAVGLALEQMQAETPEDLKFALEIHRLTPGNHAPLVGLLQTLFPAARLSLDPASSSLVAWATPPAQETIRRTIVGLDEEGAAPGSRMLKVYRLRRSNPATLVSLLTPVLPRARITADAPSNSIAVFSDEAGHTTVQAAVAALEAAPDDATRASVQFYPAPRTQVATLQALLASLVPQARIQYDEARESFVVVAIPDDHKTVGEAIATVVTDAPETEQPRLESYAVHAPQRAAVVEALATFANDLPGIRTLPDANDDRMLIWARPEQHAVIGELIAQVAEKIAPETERPRLESYEVRGEQRAAVAAALATLTNELPGIQTLPDTGNNRMLIWARPEQHAVIGELIPQITKKKAPGPPTKLIAYPLEFANAATLVPVLQAIVPQAQLVVESTANQIVAWAIAEDQEKLRVAIEQVDVDAPRASVQFYPVPHEQVATLQTLLASLVPLAQVSYDEARESFIVVAVPDDQKTIGEAIATVISDAPETERPRLESYEVRGEQRAAVVAALATLTNELPGIQTLPDTGNDRMLIWARPEQHAVMEELIAQVTEEIAPEQQAKLIAYPLEFADAASIVSVLQTIVPRAQLVVESTSNQIVAWALPEDQTKLHDAIEQVDIDTPPRQRLRLMTHPMKKADRAAVVQVLQTLLPSMRLIQNTTANTIIALGPEPDQKLVAETIERMQPSDDPTAQYRVEVYSLHDANAQAYVNALTPAFPQGSFTADVQGGRLIVWANAGDHATIAEAVERLQRPFDEGEEPEAVVHRLEHITPAVAVAALQPLFPKAQLQAEPRNQSVVAMASLRDQEAIRTILAQLDLVSYADESRSLKSYSLNGADGATALTLLQTAFIEARVTANPNTDSLLVWANVDDHEQIGKMIETLQVPEGDRPQPVVHRLEFITPAVAVATLRPLFPQAQLQSEPQNQSVVVVANQRDQEAIRATLAQLDINQRDDRRQLVAYPLDGADAASAFTLLQTAFVDARVTLNPKTDSLLVWADAEDHEQIGKMIETLQVPTEDRPQPVVHRLEFITPAVAVATLRPLFPQAQLQSEPQNQSVVVVANQRDQEAIRATLAQLDINQRDDRRQLVAYPLDGADATSALTLLQTAFVDARVTANLKTDSLLVWADTDDHEQIGKMIETLQVPTEDRPQPVVHRLEFITPAVAVATLRPLFPQAQLQSEPQNQSVVVVANQRDQEAIRATLAQLDVNQRDDRRRLVAYPLDGADAASALTLLQTAFVDARVTANLKTDSLLVWADVDDHEQISKMIGTLQVPAEDRPQPVVHRLEFITPAVAVATLRPLFPQAQLQSEPQNQSVVVVANQRDQEAIRATLAQLDVNQRDDRRLVAYPLDGADATSALTLLQTAFVDSRVISDSKTDSLLVWANVDDHAAIRQMIDTFVREVPTEHQSVTRSYILRNTDASVAQGVLIPLVPKALMAVDPRGRKLLVTAVPEDHDRIKAAIAELETGPADDLVESLQVYDVENADASVVLNTLQQVYALRTEVRLSLDPLTNKIAVWASPQQHKSIAEVIAKFDTLVDSSEELLVEVYSLGGADPASISDVLSDMLSQHPETRIVSDSTTDQLIVLAQADEQVMVKKTIEQLRTAKPTVDVLQLHFVDPYSAQLAIETLFETSGRGRKRGNAPRVDSDSATGQLFVRGTPEQLAQIRELLGKMGETFIADQTLGSGRKLRVISLPSGTVNETLEEMRRVWSQLRSNPIRVVTPSAVAPTLRKSKENKEDTPPENENGEPAKKPEPEEQSQGQIFVPRDVLAQVVAVVDDAQGESESNDGQAGEGEAEPKPEKVEPTDDHSDEASPIVIAIGKDNITIASEDVEALDQFETLLKTIVQRRPAGGREFTVFALTSANATLVAESLDKLFDQGLFGFRGAGNVTIVPDQRLNALIVQASAAELATIEGLIKVLDTNEPLDSLLRTEPRVIKVERARATEIEDVLRDVYKTRLTTGGSRPQLNAPRGSSRELQNVLQQLNAASAGPEMTLSVDIETNSLIVLAAQPLFEEVRQLVEQIDKAAEEPNRIVRVISLKRTNTKTVQGVLDSLLKNVQRQRRRSR